ncbi:hypothetical protein [Polyangium mundeleinium]|uniref:Lipoprotein n=1 Tax=Polyangium mundeleinium TaxID=2995306 RepID=A0ABT5F3J0_9BACT|nr:hypothetical protein [Polyangium mundeleinium]MDC0747702.1 hypothetical protein [Polyangium mundeleinium]
MSPALRSRLLVGSLLGLAACAEIEAAPPPLHPRGSASPDATVAAAEATPSKPAAPAEGGRQEALAPRVGIEGVADGQQALADAIVAASKAPMNECRGNSGGGTVRIRVAGNHTSASFAVDPRSTADDKMRHCVLEALSTLDVPDTISQSSPSSRPSSGFSSIITVQW